MTLEEIIRWFHRFKYDPEFRVPGIRRDKTPGGVHTVPVRNICEWAGVPYQNLYAIIGRRMRLTANYQTRLTQAIEAVQAGMRWEKHGRSWRINDPKFEQLPRYENMNRRPPAKLDEQPKKRRRMRRQIYTEFRP